MTQPDLASVLDGIWSLLEHGVDDRHNGFRTPMLATLSPSAGCTLRSVVLRAVDRERRALRFYSDLRSPKVAQMRADPRVALAFLDSVRQVQVRAEGAAELHAADHLAERCWATLAPENRRDYGAEAPPGSEIAEPSANHASDGAEAWSNFVVADCRVRRLEWLELDSSGHRRAAFTWDDDGTLSAAWLVP